jgi:uncharacterized protein (TIGR03067 family)
MRWIGTGLILGGLALFTAAADPDPAKEDLKALQGTWAIESITFNGDDVSNDYKLSLTFKGSEGTLEGDDEVRKEYAKISVKLDPESSPKCIDVTVALGAQKGTVMEGIYSLKDNQLRLCVKVLGKDRPSEFKSVSGESTALVTLKRKE